MIYDLFQLWDAKVAAKNGIKAVYFSIYGSAVLSFIHHLYTLGNGVEFCFPAIHLRGDEMRTLEGAVQFLYENIFDADRDFLFRNFKQSCEVVLVKTSRGIEGKYTDYLSDLSRKKLLPVGPLVNSKLDNSDSHIIKWLDDKTPNSTVFMSFGRKYFLSRDEIQEIAKGLEIYEVNFICIIRFPVGATITLEDALPQGFPDWVKQRGLILTGWAPQADILVHRNAGGFVSHYRWSSIMERMYFGVPVIAMPIKLDQPVNAQMLAEAGSCVEVVRSENEGFKWEEIAEVIKKAVVEKGHEGLRRRARELSEKLKMEEETAMDDVVEQLWELCLKNKVEV